MIVTNLRGSPSACAGTVVTRRPFTRHVGRSSPPSRGKRGSLTSAQPSVGTRSRAGRHTVSARSPRGSRIAAFEAPSVDQRLERAVDLAGFLVGPVLGSVSPGAKWTGATVRLCAR